MRNLLKCDICNKKSKWMVRCPGSDTEWTICDKCFERADRLALAEGECLDENYYKKLKEQLNA